MSQFYLDHDIPANDVTSFLIYREPLYFFDKNNNDKNNNDKIDEKMVKRGNRILFYLMKKSKSVRVEVRDEQCKILGYFVLSKCYYPNKEKKDLGYDIIDDVMTHYSESKGEKSITDCVRDVIISKYSDNLNDYNVTEK